MKKKILKSILSILLFTLVLGCYTNAFAWSYNEVKGTIENVITNSGYNNIYLTNLNTWIHNEVAEEWESVFSSYDNFMIMCNLGVASDNISNINHGIYVYAWNNPNDTYTLYEYKYSSSVWMLKCSVNYDKYTYTGTYNNDWENGTYYNLSTTLNTSTNLGFANRNNPPMWVIFTDKVIMANANGGTATQNWNTSGKYVPDYWTFTPYNDYGTATINGQTPWEYNVIDGIYNQPLGTIKDSLYVRKINYRYGTWNASTKTYVNGAWQTLYDYDKNGTLPAYFSGSSTHDSSYVYTTRIDINTNGQYNNILTLEIKSNDPTRHPDKTGYYYIRDNHTSIVNGIIYPNNTFSGDYNNQYNQQEQNNNITGTIQDSINNLNDKEEERDQWWRNAFNDLFTLKSGDAQNMINEFMENTELNQYGDYGIQEGILRTLEGQPQDFIIAWR